MYIIPNCTVSRKQWGLHSLSDLSSFSLKCVSGSWCKTLSSYPYKYPVLRIFSIHIAQYMSKYATTCFSTLMVLFNFIYWVYGLTFWRTFHSLHLNALKGCLISTAWFSFSLILVIHMVALQYGPSIDKKELFHTWQKWTFAVSFAYTDRERWEHTLEATHLNFIGNIIWLITVHQNILQIFYNTNLVFV